jgi:hypothetical protein
MARTRQSMHNAVTQASTGIGNFVRDFYDNVQFAMTQRGTKEPSELGLSDRFMVESRIQAIRGGVVPSHVTMVGAFHFGTCLALEPDQLHL